MDPSLTNGESRSIVSVPDGAGQTDGSVHTEVHLLLQLQQGDIVPESNVRNTVFFMDYKILQTDIFSLEECFILSARVMFSNADLNNCGDPDISCNLSNPNLIQRILPPSPKSIFVAAVSS